MFIKMFAAAAVTAASLSAPLLLAPQALAEQGDCNTSPTVTVCDSNGSASIIATPPEVGGGTMNGPYGPTGNIPPVGGI
jgi:hypothetical protein